MATKSNALNIPQTGVVYYDGTATFTGTGNGTSGQVLQSAGAATPAYSTATYPSTSSTSGNVITSDGTNFLSLPLFRPNAVINVFDDFLTTLDNIWTNTGSPAIANTASLTGANLGLKTNGTIDGGALPGPSFLAYTATSNPPIIVGGGQITLNWVINLAILSDVTNTYTLNIGFAASSANTAPANGIYIQYSSGVNSGNYTYTCSAASVATTTNSSTTATIGFHNFQIVINAAGTSVSFFVDGVSLGSAITTNIPSANIFPYFIIARNAGTIAQNSIYIDLFYMNIMLTAAR